MEIVRTAVLIAATIAMGLIAGLFYTYACSVMPGLRRVDDRAFVSAMQHINAAIQNGWFALSFFGAFLLTAVAAALHIGSWTTFALTLAGLALYVWTLGITFRVNIPLNNRLDAAGPGARIDDPGAARRAFEAPWVRWNLARALTNTAAFACLGAALVTA